MTKELSREYNGMISRSAKYKTMHQTNRLNRRIPAELARDIANFDLALACLQRKLAEPATRRAYYLLNQG